jgi:hypothetical protein
MEILDLDYVCVLKVRSPRNAMMTKRLYRATNGATGKTDYDDATTFDVEKIRVATFGDLAELLGSLVHRTDRFVVRGKLIDSHYNVRRRVHSEGAAFVADTEGHHWFMADFDGVPLPLFLEADDDPELLLRYLTRFLPPAFHDVSFYWQWSCGQGIDGWKTLRAHLWFWSREKHTDAEFERWAQWVNGEAGWKVLDHCVMRTVQPNYTAAPVIDDDVINPVEGQRQGVFIGAADEVTIKLPVRSWEQHVRDIERAEYGELVEYGLRQPYSSLDRTPGSEKYLDYLLRIGDDRDGFHEPMTKAIWHFVSVYPPDRDEEFKSALRTIVREAVCTKQRDLDEYLSDYRLDASIRGAREKQQHFKPKPQGTLAQYQQALRRHSFTRRASNA